MVWGLEWCSLLIRQLVCRGVRLLISAQKELEFNRGGPALDNEGYVVSRCRMVYLL